MNTMNTETHALDSCQKNMGVLARSWQSLPTVNPTNCSHFQFLPSSLPSPSQHPSVSTELPLLRSLHIFTIPDAAARAIRVEGIFCTEDDAPPVEAAAEAVVDPDEGLWVGGAEALKSIDDLPGLPVLALPKIHQNPSSQLSTPLRKQCLCFQNRF